MGIREKNPNISQQRECIALRELQNGDKENEHQQQRLWMTRRWNENDEFE